jgi:guanosine-3',5'-bis(diphosphate) 3'-pyrophosphohydrolase
MPPEALESSLVAEALAFAIDAHADTPPRKGDDTPYIDHPIEVAHMLYEGDFGEEVVAAALLHDVVEDTDVTVAALVGRFGGEVAALVDALTDDRSLAYNARKEAHREKVRRRGMPAAAIYAADKLANLRAFRVAYRVEGEALGNRFNAPIDVKMLHWSEDLEMLKRVDPQPPFIEELDEELHGLLSDRARSDQR